MAVLGSALGFDAIPGIGLSQAETDELLKLVDGATPQKTGGEAKWYGIETQGPGTELRQVAPLPPIAQHIVDCVACRVGFGRPTVVSAHRWQLRKHTRGIGQLSGRFLAVQPFTDDPRLAGEGDGVLTLQLNAAAEVLLMKGTKLHAVAPRPAGCCVLIRGAAYNSCKVGIAWPAEEQKKDRKHAMVALTLRAVGAAAEWTQPPQPGLFAAAAPAAAREEPLPEGWVRHYTPKGGVYYQNVQTGKISTAHPSVVGGNKSMVPPRHVPQPVGGMLKQIAAAPSLAACLPEKHEQALRSVQQVQSPTGVLTIQPSLQQQQIDQQRQLAAERHLAVQGNQQVMQHQAEKQQVQQQLQAATMASQTGTLTIRPSMTGQSPLMQNLIQSKTHFPIPVPQVQMVQFGGVGIQHAITPSREQLVEMRKQQEERIREQQAMIEQRKSQRAQALAVAKRMAAAARAADCGEGAPVESIRVPGEPVDELVADVAAPPLPQMQLGAPPGNPEYAAEVAAAHFASSAEGQKAAADAAAAEARRKRKAAADAEAARKRDAEVKRRRASGRPFVGALVVLSPGEKWDRSGCLRPGEKGKVVEDMQARGQAGYRVSAARGSHLYMEEELRLVQTQGEGMSDSDSDSDAPGAAA